MNNTDAVEQATSWMRDPDAYDPYARARHFRFMDRSFSAHSSHAEQADQWPITIRDTRTGAYVATVSNWAKLPEELAARLESEA